MAEDFRASVQYNDWKGTAAADDADKKDFSAFLRSEGLIGEDDLLIGIEFWNGENHDGKLRPAYVHALVSAQNTYDKTVKAIEHDGHAKVRRVDIDMPVEQFFGFFKRFAVAISRHGALKKYETMNDE